MKNPFRRKTKEELGHKICETIDMETGSIRELRQTDLENLRSKLSWYTKKIKKKI